jgi:LysR family transcriptional regulator of abg operon
MGASVSRSLMPAVITRFHAQHPQVKVRIMEGQLVSMINELRQGELDFTINTYYQGPYDHEFTFEKLFEKPFAVFCRKGIRRRGQHRLTNFCIITGQCRRRGEVIISS